MLAIMLAKICSRRLKLTKTVFADALRVNTKLLFMPGHEILVLITQACFQRSDEITQLCCMV